MSTDEKKELVWSMATQIVEEARDGIKMRSVSLLLNRLRELASATEGKEQDAADRAIGSLLGAYGGMMEHRVAAAARDIAEYYKPYYA